MSCCYQELVGRAIQVSTPCLNNRETIFKRLLEVMLIALYGQATAGFRIYFVWNPRLTLSDPRGVLFSQPSKVNWLPIFYVWANQIQYLMVFQVEVAYIACRVKKKILSIFFRNLSFSKYSKYTSGPIGLIRIWKILAKNIWIQSLWEKNRGNWFCFPIKCFIFWVSYSWTSLVLHICYPSLHFRSEWCIWHKSGVTTH